MLLIFFSLEVFNVVLFICVFKESVYDVLVPWKKKKNMKELYFLVFFVLFVLNVTVFVYNRLKESLILQLNQIVFYRFLLFPRFLCLLLKKYLALYIETWVRVCYYIHHLCLHVLFCVANLRYQGDIPCLTRTKSWWRLYIFLKPRSMKNQYFKLTC